MAEQDDNRKDGSEHEVRDPFDAPDPPAFAPLGESDLEMRHRPGKPGEIQEIAELPESGEIQEIVGPPHEIQEINEINELPESGEIQEIVGPPHEIFEIQEIAELPESGEIQEIVGPPHEIFEIFEIAELPERIDRDQLQRLIEKLRQRFDKLGDKPFDELPRSARQAIVHLAVVRGEDLEKHAPRFWEAATQARWPDAAKAARGLGEAKRGGHPVAEHLERGLKTGELPGGG